MKNEQPAPLLHSGQTPAPLAAEPAVLSESEATRLRAMFEQALSFIAIVEGPDLVFKLANPAYYQLVGHRPLIGLPAREALAELAGQGYIDLAAQVYESGKPFVGRQMPVQVQHAPDGPLIDRFVDFLYQPLCDRHGRVVGVFVEGYDVTEHKLALDALHVSNERWMFAIEGSRDGVWDWDVPTGRVFRSKRYRDILGYTNDDALHLHEDWVRLIHPDDLDRVRTALRGTMQGGPPYHVEYRLRCRDGPYRWVLSRGVVVVSDLDGQPLRLTGTLSDITDKKKAEATIWEYATTDQLTGLPNRRLFRERLEAELRRGARETVKFALLFIDLDRFKEVNDLRGHDIGDQILALVAQRLGAAIRETDTVARRGGDEFTVLLPDVRNLAEVEQVAQNLINRIAAPYHLKDEVVHLSASIGITLYPQDGVDSKDLVRNADQAMYAAKHAGRNQFRYFTREMQDAARLRVELLHDLRAALPAHQLQVQYQPIVELASGKITKAESLLRWRHPKHGSVSPTQFIPLAEESGLVHEIGDWVFKEAARCAKKWSAVPRQLFQVSVNCSPLQVLARSPERWQAFLLEKSPPGSLVIEITEGILLQSSPRVTEVFAQYHACGIQVALDDFGTGYSALSYLTQFDIDFLKIDRSFIEGIDKTHGSLAIVESIIAMAHKLGLKVIAEGVETPEQEALLRAAGCDYGQGFLFAAAMSAHDLEALLVHGADRVDRCP